MSQKNIILEETVDLESRVTILEARVTVLEQSSKQVIRKKREYTDEQRAIIRARLLAGQEAARKRREIETIAELNEVKAEITVEPEPLKTEKPRKVVKTRNQKSQ
jgi:hypothetical protein